MRFRILTRGLAVACAVLVSLAALAQTEPQTPKAPRGFLKKVAAAASLYQKENDTKAAIGSFEALVTERPNDFDANAWLGYLYLMDGRDSDSLLPLGAGHKANPADIGVAANLATAQSRLGQWANAASSYEMLTGMRPEDATLWAQLGMARLKSNDASGAIDALKKSDELKADDPNVLASLAEAHIKRGDSAAAEAVYTRLSAIGGAPADALGWMGYYALQQGRPADAVTYLEKANQASPNDVLVMNNLAVAYMQGTPPQNGKAKALYRRITEVDSSLYEPWYNLGVLALGDEDYATAQTANEAALRLKQGEPFATNNLGRAHEGMGHWAIAAEHYAKASDARAEHAVFARNAGVAYIRAANDAKARKYLERAIANGDTEPSLKLMLGELAMREGRIDDAMRLLNGMESRVADVADYWYNVGVTKAKSGDKPGAIEAYRKCLAARASDADATKNLGLLYLETGQNDEALAIFKKIAAANPSSIDAKMNLAAVYVKTGQTALAVPLWRDIVRAQPDSHDVRLNLANATWARGDFETARFHFATVLKARPNDAQALNGMGLWSLRASENAKAEGYFRSAIRAKSDFATAYNNLAITLERLNRRREAIQVLEKAVTMKPELPEARKNLERMKAAQG